MAAQSADPCARPLAALAAEGADWTLKCWDGDTEMLIRIQYIDPTTYFSADFPLIWVVQRIAAIFPDVAQVTQSKADFGITVAPR